MAPRRPQPDLLDWTPPQPTEAFAAPQVRAATFVGRLSRAVAAVLERHGGKRADLAAAMTVYLGKPVSKAMLDAYASQGREEHVISVERLMALIHATRDRRLLELLAEPFGWTVIDRKYLPLIELASVRDKQEELQRHADALKRAARSGGLL